MRTEKMAQSRSTHYGKRGGSINKWMDLVPEFSLRICPMSGGFPLRGISECGVLQGRRNESR